MKLPALLVFLLLLPGPASGAGTAGPLALPSWFTETFLDFREDVAQAAREGRRLMILFEQDGCPYCKELILTNFSQKTIADKARKKFLAVSLNIWGDREVTWTDGKKFSEKRLAAFLKPCRPERRGRRPCGRRARPRRGRRGPRPRGPQPRGILSSRPT